MPAPMRRFPASEIVAVSSQPSRQGGETRSRGRRRGRPPTIAPSSRTPTIDAISNTLPTHLHPDIDDRRAGGRQACAAREAVRADRAGMRRHDRDGEGERPHPDAGACLPLLGRLCFPGGVRAERPARQAAVGERAPRLSQLPAWADWFLDPALSGGAVLDLSVHDFDVVNWVLGTPKTGLRARPGISGPACGTTSMPSVDYGDANGFVEGSEFMPAGLSLHLRPQGALRGRRGRVPVPRRRRQRRDGGRQLADGPRGRARPIRSRRSRATPTRTRRMPSSPACATGEAPTLGTAEQARLAVRTANAVRELFETGQVVAI